MRNTEEIISHPCATFVYKQKIDESFQNKIINTHYEQVVCWERKQVN